MATGISVQVDGVEVNNPTTYSVNEEGTPVDAADTTGAAGRITVGLYSGSTDPVDAKRMYRKNLRIADPENGFTDGVVRVPSASNGSVSVVADVRIVLMAAQRQAAPYEGTVAGYAEYLLSLVGIVDHFVIDASFAAIPAVVPGWEGDVWLMAKGFAATYVAEWTYASGNVVFRPMRQRIAENRRNSEVSWSMDDSNLARSVEGYWYETAALTDTLVYPVGGWSSDVPVIQVDAREKVVVDYPLLTSLESIVQPVAVDYVDRYDNSLSQYCVQGNDGLPLTAAQWNDAGGSIVVEIGPDTRSITVTVTGPDLDQYAPFRIAATAGPSDVYSSLRIIGTGIFFNKHLVTRPTSVPDDIATVELGASIDLPFITSLDQLTDVLSWTVARFSTPRTTLTVRTRGINRNGDTGSYAYPTFDDFNAYAADQGWTDFDDLTAAAPGEGWTSFDAFNAWWTATVSEDFANQAFGNVAGARIFQDGLWFRIRTVTITPDGVSYTAEGDTTLDDFTEFATEQGWTTFNDFNAAWAGKTFDDFNLGPLTNGD